MLFSVSLILNTNAESQIQVLSCTNQYGQEIPCGGTWIAVKDDGSRWLCTCTCDMNITSCVPLDESNTSTTTTNTYSAPSQQELDAYYNGQWSGYLFEQADKEFKKGLEDYNNGDCKAAAQHFKKAMAYMDNSIYTEYYNAATQCSGNNSTAQTTFPPTNTTPPPPPTTQPNNSTTTTSPNYTPRDRINSHSNNNDAMVVELETKNCMPVD